MSHEILFEEFSPDRAFGESSRVDEEAGVIYGACLIAPESMNKGMFKNRFYEGRDYEEAALDDVANLSPGLPVFANGHGNPPGKHEVLDEVAVIKNVVKRDGKRFGDVHFDLQDARSLRLLKRAKERPRSMALSVEAVDNDMSLGADNRLKIHRVKKVQGFGIVRDGGTTRSVFEERDSLMTLTDLTLEELKKDRPDLVKILEESAVAELKPDTDTVSKREHLELQIAHDKIKAEKEQLEKQLADLKTAEELAEKEEALKAKITEAGKVAPSEKVLETLVTLDDEALLEEFIGNMADLKPGDSANPEPKPHVPSGTKGKVVSPVARPSRNRYKQLLQDYTS